MSDIRERIARVLFDQDPAHRGEWDDYNDIFWFKTICYDDADAIIEALGIEAVCFVPRSDHRPLGDGKLAKPDRIPCRIDWHTPLYRLRGLENPNE